MTKDEGWLPYPTGERRTTKDEGRTLVIRLWSFVLKALGAARAACYNVRVVHGGVPEWTIGAVSKTVVALWVTVSSNLTPSASPALDCKGLLFSRRKTWQV